MSKIKITLIGLFQENEKKNTRCIREDNEDIMYLQGLGNVTKFNIFCEIDD